ncbi:hypothetical protein D3C80_19890 [compost metagenome]
MVHAKHGLSISSPIHFCCHFTQILLATGLRKLTIFIEKINGVGNLIVSKKISMMMTSNKMFRLTGDSGEKAREIRKYAA